MSKLTIAVNARMLLENRLDGIGFFAHQTLRLLTVNHPDVNFIFYFDRSYNSKFIYNSNIRPIVVPPKTIHPLLTNIWLNYSLKNELEKLKPDLFLSLDGFLSINAKCKQLVVIHDLNFFHNPKDLPILLSHFYNNNVKKSALIADRIITVSEFCKNDIAKTYGVNPNKIDVIYNGVDNGYAPLDFELKKEIRNKFSNGEEYFLFVGSMHPRKNIPRLIQSFDLFKQQTNNKIKLLLVGPEFWGFNQIQKVLNKTKFKNDIIFTGRLNDQDLKLITASAFCLVFPPYFEGFGVPIIEAMRSGIPVICSNSSAIPEVADKAALLFNPFKTEEIAEAMKKIYFNSDLRLSLIKSGFERSKQFNWEISSNKLWDSIEKILF